MKKKVTKDYVINMRGCYKERIIDMLFNSKSSTPVIDILTESRVPLHHRISFLLKACDLPIDFCIDKLGESLSEATGLAKEMSLEKYMEEHKHKSVHLEKSLRFYIVANECLGEKNKKNTIIENLCASVKYLELWAVENPIIIDNFINKISEKIVD